MSHPLSNTHCEIIRIYYQEESGKLDRITFTQKYYHKNIIDTLTKYLMKIYLAVNTVYTWVHWILSLIMVYLKEK